MLFNHERAERKEHCKRAYHLAAYVLGDLVAAERVATKAVDALELQFQQVCERRRDQRSQRWYKLCPNKEFMLHLLVWYYCVEVEREQERDYREGRRTLDEETMLVRFIKELLDDGFRHKSFQLLVGLFRVLSSYATKDAQTLNSILSPDDDGGPDDYAYRRQKSRYMKMLTDRFPGLLQVTNVQGEARFLKKETPSDSLRLVEEALNLFTPTKPRCLPLRDEFDPTTHVVEEFLSTPARHSRPDSQAQREKEYDVDQLRMHFLTHSPCRSKLLEIADLSAFEEHLEVPEFFLNRHGGLGPPPLDRRNIPPLSEEQEKRMNLTLHSCRERRRRMPPDEVIVSVDGAERGVLRLNAPQKLRLVLDSGNRMIEFTGQDEGGSLLLGTHLLQWDEGASAFKPEGYRLALRDRCKVEFEVNYLRQDDDLTGAVVELDYRKMPSPWVLPVVAVGALLFTASASFVIYKYSKRVGTSE
jgi:hypothetical protein